MAYKVLQFIHGLTMGGAERVVRDYCCAASDAGFGKGDLPKVEMAVLCFSRQGTALEQELLDRSVRLIFLSDYMRQDGLCAFLRAFPVAPVRTAYAFLERLFLSRRLLRREKPDILHGHLLVNLYTFFAGLGRECRLFYTVHNEPEAIWPRGSAKRLADYLAARWLVRHRGMKLFALHEKQKEKTARRFPGAAIEILPNGIDLSRKAGKTRVEMRQMLGIPQEAFVAGHVGRFSPEKNHLFLLEIFREIQKARGGKDAFLLLVGHGELREEILRKIGEWGLGDAVRVLSQRGDVPELMGCMDVLVFPSLWEGLPLTLLEAQRAGLPCLVSTGVPRLSLVHSRIRRMRLSRGASAWARAAVREAGDRREIEGLSGYDIHGILRRLFRLYGIL